MKMDWHTVSVPAKLFEGTFDAWPLQCSLSSNLKHVQCGLLCRYAVMKMQLVLMLQTHRQGHRQVKQAASITGAGGVCSAVDWLN